MLFIVIFWNLELCCVSIHGKHAQCLYASSTYIIICIIKFCSLIPVIVGWAKVGTKFHRLSLLYPCCVAKQKASSLLRYPFVVIVLEGVFSTDYSQVV